MPRTIGRRTLFFTTLAIVGLILVYPTPADFRAVAWFVVAMAGFWAVMFAIEDLATPRFPPRTEPEPIVENPFAPPPPPGKASPGSKYP